MFNSYESFVCGQATCEVMNNLNPTFNAIEKAAGKLATPICLSVLVTVHPVAATFTEGVKSLFVNQAPTVRTLNVENSVDANFLNLTIPTSEEATSTPFQGQKPKPSFVPGLSTFTATTSGDTIQIYGYYSTVERSIQKINAPEWLHEESSLPNQPAPAYLGVRIV